jgi:DNA-binding CsgD family transcriptional regulator
VERPAHAVDDSTRQLARGREAFERRAWQAAYESLSGADRSDPLSAADLELLATAAYMLGRDEGWERCLERAHYLYAEAGNTPRAVRCAFWVGMSLLLRGEVGPGTGWLGRAQRLLEREGGDCAEQGYLLMPLVFQYEAAGDYAAAAALAGEAAVIAERFGDVDGFALAVQAQGYMLIKAGCVAEGLTLLDEAMVAVTTRPLSPVACGLVYCGVILACQEAYELRRAREWTDALSQWCEEQPDLVAFTGRCLVHRAEILQLHGSWVEALKEAERASARLAAGFNLGAAAEASYRRAELHRLTGELAPAEDAYREASRLGREPQPGLALLRLAQGRDDDAAAAIKRALAETGDQLARAALLPAAVEIMLATHDLDGARAAVEELESLAERVRGELLTATLARARGAVELAGGDAREALVELRRAFRLWHELGAPYESARTRVLVGVACRALGDEDSAKLELEAARDVFTTLGAAPDVARVDSLAEDGRTTHGLTRRELEVLRLLAAGKSNKEIAAELVLSERTVERHVSNVFTKLRVSSRAAATAYAYQHRLLELAT